jgi:two-component system NtrC family sensor kinase
MQLYIADEKKSRMRCCLFIFFLILGPGCMAQVRPSGMDSLWALIDTVRVDESQIELRLSIAEEISNSDIRAALELAREALRLAERYESPKLAAEAKLAIGRYYDYLGVREEAIVLLIDALSMFEELEEPREEAQALMYIGNAYWYLNQYESALKYYNRCAEYAEELNDTSLIISAINAKGAAYGNIDRMDTALVLFREAFALARKSGSREQVIHTYFNLGDLYLYSGRVDDALGIFYDLEQNYDLETYSTKYLGNLYNSMTQAFIRKGDIKWARRYAEKARLALGTYTRLTGMRNYYFNCYQIDTMENDVEAALEHYYRFSELNDSLNNSGFKERLVNLEIYFDLKAKESEIERLTLDNQFKDLQIRQRKIINYGSIAGIALLFTIVFLLVRSAVRTREKNLLLEEANKMITEQSKALQEKNAELESLIEELKTTQQHLVQSEKMASLGTLTAGIAHEINNPLNFISGGLGIIAEADKKDSGLSAKERTERRSRAFKMALDGLERASAIVRALMTFSHKGMSRQVKSDLNEIIDNTLLFLHSRLSADIRIEKDYRLKKAVAVYPEKMHQVVMNIIENAIQAVHQIRSGEKLITISTRLQDDRVILEITNNGPAIREEHLNQLFDPFFTTREPGEGTGLGLSISYSLVSDHQGTIRAENRPGQVAFIIEIPA